MGAPARKLAGRAFRLYPEKRAPFARSLFPGYRYNPLRNRNCCELAGVSLARRKERKGADWKFINMRVLACAANAPKDPLREEKSAQGC